MANLKNGVNPLTWNVPIVNSDGTPTNEFQRKWAQQASANGSIPDLTTAAGVSKRLDLLGALPGMLLERGPTAWGGLASPADATKFLNGAALPAYAAVKDSDLALTDITTNNVTSTKHGFAPKSPADATKFLNGTATPAYAAVKDSDLALTDITTNNVSITAHGFAPKAPNDVTKFLNGLGAYSAPTVGAAPQPTVQTFTATGAFTWTRPVGVVRIEVEFKGGGGGTPGIANGAANAGGDGGDTVFNSVHAAGGKQGVTNGAGGAGGSGGTGTALWRYPGIAGNAVLIAIWSATNFISIGGIGGGNGGGAPSSSGAGAAGNNGVANSGGGAGGALVPNATQSTLANWGGSGGAGEGERVFLVVGAPGATIAGSVGAGGTAGAAPAGGFPGGVGGSGYVIVREFYV